MLPNPFSGFSSRTLHRALRTQRRKTTESADHEVGEYPVALLIARLVFTEVGYYVCVLFILGATVEWGCEFRMGCRCVGLGSFLDGSGGSTESW